MYKLVLIFCSYAVYLIVSYPSGRRYESINSLLMGWETTLGAFTNAVGTTSIVKLVIQPLIYNMIMISAKQTGSGKRKEGKEVDLTSKFSIHMQFSANSVTIQTFSTL